MTARLVAASRSDMRKPSPHRRLDLLFLVPVLALLAIGIAMVFSASFVVAHTVYGNETYFFVRHIGWVGVGIVAMLVVAHIDYSVWRTVAWPFYALSVLFLVLVLIPGVGQSNYGATRWLGIGPILSFQPSELAKLAVVVYLAAWITRVGGDIGKLGFGTIPFVIILALSAGLVAIEPDLGTTVILILAAGAMFFIAGANLLHALVGAILGSALILKTVSGTGYQSDRIAAFLNPWADPSGVGWHITQTLLALGSGGLGGLGLGAGRQKFFYIPNAHTDSIFAIVGEEIGFIGTTFVLLLFLVVAWRGLSIAASTSDPLGRALAAGASLLISTQGLLNMAVVSHVLPTTGVPLPLLSYGGSSMVISLVAVGIVLSVARSLPPEPRFWQAWIHGPAVSSDPPVSPAHPQRRRVRMGRLD